MLRRRPRSVFLSGDVTLLGISVSVTVLGPSECHVGVIWWNGEGAVAAFIVEPIEIIAGFDNGWLVVRTIQHTVEPPFQFAVVTHKGR